MPRFVGILLCLALAAVTQSGPGFGQTRLTSENLNDAQAAVVSKELLAPGQLASSTIYVVRMRMDGKVTEASSLDYVLLGSTDEKPPRGMTVLRFTSDLKDFILFTRDPKTGAGSRLVIPVATLEKKPQFSFKVLQPDGRLKDEKVEVIDVLRRP